MVLIKHHFTTSDPCYAIEILPDVEVTVIDNEIGGNMLGNPGFEIPVLADLGIDHSLPSWGDSWGNALIHNPADDNPIQPAESRYGVFRVRYYLQW